MAETGALDEDVRAIRGVTANDMTGPLLRRESQARIRRWCSGKENN
jgi:hypothetical protein